MDTNYLEDLSYSCNLLKNFCEKVKLCQPNSGNMSFSIGTGTREVTLTRELSAYLANGIYKVVSEEIKKVESEIKQVCKNSEK